MSKVSHLLSDSSVTVNVDGHTAVFTKDNPVYDQVVNLLREGRENDIADIVLSLKKTVEAAYPDFIVRDGVVFVGNESLPQALSDKIRKFAQQGLPYKNLLAFWNRLKANPSSHSVRELLTCLETNHHPIFENGCFMAWKGVRQDYRDTFSGKFDNTPGNTVKIERREVDDDNHNSCSYGLHVASYDYASDWANSHGGKLVELIVDPANVVSVPTDSNHQKMRVCEYTVLKEVPTSQFTRTEEVVRDYDEYNDEYEDDYEDDYYDEDDDWDSEDSSDISDDDWTCDDPECTICGHRTYDNKSKDYLGKGSHGKNFYCKRNEKGRFTK